MKNTNIEDILEFESIIAKKKLDNYINNNLQNILYNREKFARETEKILKYSFSKTRLNDILKSIMLTDNPNIIFEKIKNNYKQKLNIIPIQKTIEKIAQLFYQNYLVTPVAIFKNNTYSTLSYNKNNIIEKIEGRVKSLDSLLEKYKFKLIEEQDEKSIKDYYGVRIVVKGDKTLNSTERCYAVSELILKHFEPLKINQKILVKDYFKIKTPRTIKEKTELYKAVHLYIFQDSDLLEIQIMPLELYQKTKCPKSSLYHKYYKTYHKLDLLYKKTKC